MLNYTQKVTVPTAFVTKGRQRVKQYDNNVYLKNGDEFEIELFNPTTNKILAKISLNGKLMGNGSGIVLRPGERVFLERHLDEARKFKYETYLVDSKDVAVQKAIEYNGLVEVEFYDEFRTQASYPYYTSGNTYYYRHAFSTFTGDNTRCFSKSSDEPINAVYSCSADMGVKDFCSYDANIKSMKIEETGRIENGSASGQVFEYDHTTFNSYYSWSQTWKILPESQKSLTKEDLVIYCTKCGARRKKTSFKYCPLCGQAY